MRSGELEWRDEDTVEALLARYRAEKDGALKPRWQALWLLRRGKSRSQVVDALGVDPRTLRDWVGWYRQGGCPAIAEHRKGKRGGGRPRLTPQQFGRIDERAAQGFFRNAAAVQEWVRREWGVVYTYWGMRSILDRLQIHLRVPRPLAAKADLAAQDAWKRGVYGEH